ncbi:MAG: hypothetical protein K2N66_07340, partial [Paramuribaculum sp.]|nr:hypothetical protein [Paramuribaculum sp.]
TQLTIIPTPDTGYKLSSLTVSTENGDESLNSEPYTYTVNGPITVKAMFVRDNVNYSELTLATPEHGDLLVTSAYNDNLIYKSGQSVAINTKLLVTATPQKGYKLTRITAGNRNKEFNTAKADTIICLTTAGKYNITATFAEYKTSAVTWTRPDTTKGTMTVKNGDAAVTSGAEVENGTTLIVTLTASEGYTPALKVNSAPTEATSTSDNGRTKTYTVTVTAATALVAEFTKNSYTVSIADAENGSVKVMANGQEVANGASIDHGTQLTIIPTPDTGYKLSSLTVSTENGDEPLNSEPYTYTVTGPITVKAMFVRDNVNYSELTFATPEHGDLLVTSAYNDNLIYKSGQSIAINTKLLVTATPQKGYKLTRITAGN